MQYTMALKAKNKELKKKGKTKNVKEILNKVNKLISLIE